MSGLLLWDFDGTLAYHTETWSGCLARILQELAPELGITRDLVSPHLSSGFPWHVPHRPHTDIAGPDGWWAALSPVFRKAARSLGADADIAQSADQLMRRDYPAPMKFRLFDDVVPTLRELSVNGWRHAVLSNHTPELPDIVAGLGLGSSFEAVITSAVTGYEKPHRQMFQVGLQLACPGEPVWMIGDNYHADVLGAEAAGLPAVLVRQRHPAALHQAAGLQEVIHIVKTEA